MNAALLDFSGCGVGTAPLNKHLINKDSDSEAEATLGISQKKGLKLDKAMSRTGTKELSLELKRQ